MNRIFQRLCVVSGEIIYTLDLKNVVYRMKSEASTSGKILLVIVLLFQILLF